MQGTTLMQTLQNSDMVQQYMWGFSPDNPGFVGILVAALIAFLIGYVEQFLSIIMIKKEKHGSFPMPLNTFYLAHDFLTGVIFLILGFMNSFFYIFMVLGIGMFIWNFTEIIDMYDYVKNNREETFRGMFFGELTAKKCVLEIVAETLAFAVFILLMIVLMDDPVFLKWFMITNILIAVCTGYYWTKNKVVWGYIEAVGYRNPHRHHQHFLACWLGLVEHHLPHYVRHAAVLSDGCCVGVLCCQERLHCVQEASRKAEDARWKENHLVTSLSADVVMRRHFCFAA